MCVVIYLERFASLKGEAGCGAVLLAPVVLDLCVAHNDFAVVLMEAGVEVEGDVVAFLKIHPKSATDRRRHLVNILDGPAFYH